MAAAFAPARVRTGLLSLVLGLHLLLAGLLWQLGAWKDRLPPPAPQPALQVWLLRPGPPSAATPPPAATAQPTHRPATTAPPPRRAPREPQAITETAPAVSAAPDLASSAALPASVTAREPGPAPPLNLRLPRGASAPWRQRHPGLDDPRVRRLPATVESRIAGALGGSDEITQENLSDGRILLRRGKDCVIVNPNRAQTLDPWNASAFPKPASVQRC